MELSYKWKRMFRFVLLCAALATRRCFITQCTEKEIQEDMRLARKGVYSGQGELVTDDGILVARPNTTSRNVSRSQY